MLSVAMCEALRRLGDGAGGVGFARRGTLFALRSRGLAAPEFAADGRLTYWRLTSRGVQVALLLGPDNYSLQDAVLHHTVEICGECGEPRDPRVMAWDTQDEHFVKCIECAVKGMGV